MHPIVEMIVNEWALSVQTCCLTWGSAWRKQLAVWQVHHHLCRSQCEISRTYTKQKHVCKHKAKPINSYHTLCKSTELLTCQPQTQHPECNWRSTWGGGSEIRQLAGWLWSGRGRLQQRLWLPTQHRLEKWEGRYIWKKNRTLLINVSYRCTITWTLASMHAHRPHQKERKDPVKCTPASPPWRKIEAHLVLVIFFAALLPLKKWWWYRKHWACCFASSQSWGGARKGRYYHNITLRGQYLTLPYKIWSALH